MSGRRLPVPKISGESGDSGDSGDSSESGDCGKSGNSGKSGESGDSGERKSGRRSKKCAGISCHQDITSSQASKLR